jgi:hypothetical protein
MKAELPLRVPYPLAGKVAPPRNEAETDGAGTSQLKLYARVSRTPFRLDPKRSRHLPRRSSGGGIAISPWI